MSYYTDRITDYILSKIFCTPQKLNKLIFLINGYYLAFYDKPLIKETSQAWKYGTIIESTYHKYRKVGNNEIPKEKFCKKLIDKKDRKFIDLVLNTYKNLSGVQLSTLTHSKNSPWEITWNKVIKGEVENLNISEGLIKNYYKNIINEKQNKPLRTTV